MMKGLSLLSARSAFLLWALCATSCVGDRAAQLDDCTGDEATIGDDVCDSKNDVSVCRYDGGDCCDTDAVSKDWVVANSNGATNLARSIVCSKGNYSVEWRGEVTVTDTIWVTNGTTLTVRASTSFGPAIADGQGDTQLFSVVGGVLHISDLELSNGASVLGGAVFVGRGAVATFNRTSFKDNFASEHGGALYVDGAGDASWTGDSTFSGNVASVDGGAVYVCGGSTVSWKGEGQTVFFNNKADGSGDCRGGALSVVEESHASWSSKTKFDQNYACTCGGAIFGKSESSISWNGETNITLNEAHSGGGVCLRSSSILSWTSKTLLAGNNATKEDGGAVLAADNSSVSWEGDETTIAKNRAVHDGGGVRVTDWTNLSFTGNTYFVDNFADDGGALAIGANSVVVCNGITRMANNRAFSDGGAVYASMTGRIGRATISFYGVTTFEKNSCGSYGGALMLGGSAFINFGLVKVAFTNNSAGSTGGAVFLAGVGIGPRFTGVSFTGNEAQVGGAIYATGSGTTLTEEEADHATVYEDCWFEGNNASFSGGAMESAAGKDVIRNSTFVQNRAPEGGALRLAGFATITGCQFHENQAGQAGGPAVATIGFTSEMTNCTFSGNVFICGEGTYLDFDEGGHYEAVCNGCSECQGTCNLTEKDAPVCKSAIEHTTSKGGGRTLATLVMDSGYWRTTNSSRDVLECYHKDACMEAETGTAGNCNTGYEGAYCAVCSDGYAESLAFRCSKCSRSRQVVFAAVVIPLVAILVLVLILFLVSKESGRANQSQGRLSRFKEWVPLNSAKIVIVSWQIMASISGVGNVTFPDIFQYLLNGLEVLNFDVGFALSSGGCFNINYYGRLLAITLGPIVFTGLLGLTYKIARYRNRRSSEALQKVRGKHSTVFFWMTFLLYSTASSIVFKAFACDKLDDKVYLRADYRIECTSDRHMLVKIYASLMIFVYPLGIPLLYAAVLFWGRDAWKIAGVRSRNDAYVQAATILTKPYRPGCFYYEVVECARRMLLTGAVVFIYPDSSAQVAITLLMACAFSLVYEALAPYSSHWDSWVARAGHIIVLLSVFVAFLLEAELAVDSHESNVFGGILVAINVCLIMAVMVEGASLACTVSKSGEDSLPRAVMNAAQGFAEPAVGFGNAAMGFFPRDESRSSSRRSNSARDYAPRVVHAPPW